MPHPSFISSRRAQAYGCPFYGYLGTLDPTNPDTNLPNVGAGEVSEPGMIEGHSVRVLFECAFPKCGKEEGVESWVRVFPFT